MLNLKGAAAVEGFGGEASGSRMAKDGVSARAQLAITFSPLKCSWCGWAADGLEAKMIPKPNGRLTRPYLHFRARRAARVRCVYLGKLTQSDP
jgi:hypothetical protein